MCVSTKVNNMSKINFHFNLNNGQTYHECVCPTQTLNRLRKPLRSGLNYKLINKNKCNKLSNKMAQAFYSGPSLWWLGKGVPRKFSHTWTTLPGPYPTIFHHSKRAMLLKSRRFFYKKKFILFFKNWILLKANLIDFFFLKE